MKYLVISIASMLYSFIDEYIKDIFIITAIFLNEQRRIHLIHQ